MVSADEDPEVVTAQLLRISREADEAYELEQDAKANAFAESDSNTDNVAGESFSAVNDVVSTSVIVPQKTGEELEKSYLLDVRLGVIAIILLLVVFLFFRKKS